MNASVKTQLRRIAAKVFGWGIVAVARIVTGARSLWHSPPEALPTVYFANHNSHADFALVWATLPPDLRHLTRPVAGADYWLKTPFKSFIGKDVINALMIAREGGANRGENNPVQQMTEALQMGDSLIIFPEGTRNMGEELLLPMKSGIYHLAKNCPEVRFVPVWIENLKRVLPKGVVVPIPIACTVRYGKPLQFGPDETKAAFLEKVRLSLLDLRPDYDKAEERKQTVIVQKPAEQTMVADMPTEKEH